MAPFGLVTPTLPDIQLSGEESIPLGIDQKIDGTAATGKAIIDSLVIVKGKGGIKSFSQTDSNGKFSIRFNDDPGAVLLRVDRQDLPSLYSVISNQDATLKTVNIHPYTDIIIRNWFAVENLDIDAEFNSNVAISSLPTATDIENINRVITSLISIAIIQFQIGNNFNLILSPFDANQMGFDSFLDFSQVTIINNIATIVVIDPVSLLRTVIATLDLSQDLTLQDTTPPSTPQNLRALAAGDTKITLLWDVASDNIGIAGYEIIRADNVIASTSHSTYTETGLTANTEYCYFVDAIDGSGNTSARAATATCVTTEPTDTTAPSSISDVSAQVTLITASTISLSWTAAPEADVAGYYINRKMGATIERIGSSTSPTFVDTNLDASTQYCYTVEAYDASLNTSIKNIEFCATTKIGTVDTIPPTIVATPNTGNFRSQISVLLTCNDGGGSGCDTIYYTLDGNEPSAVPSAAYSGTIVLSATTTLKFFAVDNAGNVSATSTEIYNITLPPSAALNVISNDSIGVVSSDILGIDCGATCQASFDIDSQITLTANHSGGLVVIWSGCTSSAANTCVVKMNQDHTVHASFVTNQTEIALNDTFDIGQQILSASVVTVFFDTTTDADFYTINVTTRGTFFAALSHPSATSFLTLYNSLNRVVASSGGCCGTAVQKIAYSLNPGKYYLRVLSDSVVDLVTPYRLALSGTVLGTISPEVYEENDSFATATPLPNNAVGSMQGYLDTVNDADYYSFTVTSRSTFMVTISHPYSPSFITLFNKQFAVVTSSGGCCGVAAHTMTRSLNPGTCYVRVLSDAVSNLNVPYKLKFSGTALLNGTSPDIYEENDSFATAKPVTDNAVGDMEGYLDTVNDADFYSFTVSKRSTFFVTISHPGAPTYMTLYNEQFAVITSSGGCCGLATHTMTRSLNPGTYYVRVLSNNDWNLTTPYKLSFSGTALVNGTSPDIYEDNDSFATAKPVTDNAVGNMEGYLDTINDADFYSFTVSTRSTFFVTISHPGAPSFMTLYNEKFAVVTRSGGCCGLATHTMTQSLNPGTYYVRVLSDSVSNLTTPYKLSFSGTAFVNGVSPDSFEENDSFANATSITDATTYQAYFDTINDADFYTITAATTGTLAIDVAHPSVTSFITIYAGDKVTVLARSGGCCGAASHALSIAVTAGTTYYIKVLTDRIYNLTTPYTLITQAIQ